MDVLFALLIFTLTLMIQANAQKECFSSKSSLAANYSQSGPLKMSLTDPIKDFETGSYTIMNTQTTQRFTCFNITLLYINTKNSYEVVGSIQDIESYQDTAGLDFSIRFSASQAIIEGLFIMSQTAQWASASVHYVISNREDFRVGTFVPEMMQFLPCGRESEDVVVHHRLVRAWNASTQLVFGLPFLSGIRTIDTELNITFGRSSFDPSTSVLSIPATFSQVQFPIQYMLISYCIVTMTSDFQIANIYDLNYIPSDINVFVGMTGVRLAPQEITGLKSSTPITLVKSRFEEFFSVQGLVIQSSSNLDILFSDGSYGKDEVVVECVTVERCQGYDGYMTYYQNQNGFLFHSECVLCEKYASYNNLTLKCQCRQLYVRIGQQCVERDEICGNTQVYNETTAKCGCASGYVERNGTCVECPQGYTVFKGNCYKLTKTSSDAASSANANSGSSQAAVSTITAQQQPECPSLSTYNETTKSCQCQSPSYFDQLQRKCLSCQQNELYNTKAKQCECMSGSFRINGVCDFCSLNGFFNGSGCQCLPGYLGNGKICREDSKFDNGLSSSVVVGKDNGLQDVNITAVPSNLSKESQLTLKQAIVLGTIILD